MLNGHWTKDELSINNQPYVHRKELGHARLQANDEVPRDCRDIWN